ETHDPGDAPFLPSGVVLNLAQAEDEEQAREDGTERPGEFLPGHCRPPFRFSMILEVCMKQRVATENDPRLPISKSGNLAIWLPSGHPTRTPPLKPGKASNSSKTVGAPPPGGICLPR